jgi:purine-binding chemotaxis protein CheW
MTAEPNEMTRSRLLATFRLRDAHYALDAAVVLEVIRVGEITPVPHSPCELLGVINLRGRIVSLIDMAQVLGLPKQTLGARSRVFIVEHSGEYVGLLADEVGEVAELEEHQLQPPPASVPLERLRYCLSVCRLDHRVVMLLDSAALLELPQLGIQAA